MDALTFQGKTCIEFQRVTTPKLQETTDAIVRQAGSPRRWCRRPVSPPKHLLHLTLINPNPLAAGWICVACVAATCTRIIAGRKVSTQAA